MKTNEQEAHRIKNEATIKKAGLFQKDPPAYDRFFSSGFHKKYHLLKN